MQPLKTRFAEYTFDHKAQTVGACSSLSANWYPSRNEPSDEINFNPTLRVPNGRSKCESYHFLQFAAFKRQNSDIGLHFRFERIQLHIYEKVWERIYWTSCGEEFLFLMNLFEKYNQFLYPTHPAKMRFVTRRLVTAMKHRREWNFDTFKSLLTASSVVFKQSLTGAPFTTHTLRERHPSENGIMPTFAIAEPLRFKAGEKLNYDPIKVE